ncbi:uncharacterized protein LOC143154567 [Ptiloglossa arizonensis]|uniref:uncharacterized protein LOC143154567 n=1 Tax=Ptiloglossa arizonensis TaxID=3350558 RepID=UPI003FA140BF
MRSSKRSVSINKKTGPLFKREHKSRRNHNCFTFSVSMVRRLYSVLFSWSIFLCSSPKYYTPSSIFQNSSMGPSKTVKNKKKTHRRITSEITIPTMKNPNEEEDKKIPRCVLQND